MGRISDTAFHIEAPHALQFDDVLEKLNVTADGLTAEEAAKRLQAVGPNRLPAPSWSA